MTQLVIAPASVHPSQSHHPVVSRTRWLPAYPVPLPASLAAAGAFGPLPLLPAAGLFLRVALVAFGGFHALSFARRQLVTQGVI